MKIFIDTAPFIYYIEEHPDFGQVVMDYFQEQLEQEKQLITSVLTITEFGVKPARDKKPEINAQFEEFLLSAAIPTIVITKNIAREAYQLRAKYISLKAMDSLQIATAIQENCVTFFTNDKKLRQITELKVVILDDLMNDMPS